jgi:hypothetical protein
MSSVSRFAFGAVLVLLVVAPAHADKCTGAKLKAVGKKESGLLGCQSKVAAKNDSSGLAACEMKVSVKFSAAFGKAGSCAGDEMRCEDIADLCESSVAGAFLETFPSKCEAAKRKAAGKLASGELGCYAKAAAKALAVDSGCITKATGKFSAAMTKAGPCPDGGSPQNLVEDRCVAPALATSGGMVTDVCPLGATGTPCATNADCVTQACCDGTCTDLTSDPYNCSACGVMCNRGNSFGPSCTGGTCVYTGCPFDLADCDKTPPDADGCETGVTTVLNCGACGNVCPGYQEPNDNVTCNVNETCTFSCEGENYDVNNDPSDGCEVADSPQGNHTSSTPASAGPFSDCDGGVSVPLFSGTLPSDRRVHENPAVVGFDTVSGSAPDWVSITPTTSTFCQNDIVATLNVMGSAFPTCYKLTIISNSEGLTYSCQTMASGSCSINQANGGQFADGASVLFEISKTCSSTQDESVAYEVDGHF